MNMLPTTVTLRLLRVDHEYIDCMVNNLLSNTISYRVSIILSIASTLSDTYIEKSFALFGSALIYIIE